MSKEKNSNKKDFVNLHLRLADGLSNNRDMAKEFLKAQGINTEKLLSEGLKKIKKMQMLANADATRTEMQASEEAKAKAVAWVDRLLADVNFSLSAFVREEELSMSFRNLEDLNREELRNTLIRHFTLKFMNSAEGPSE